MTIRDRTIQIRVDRRERRAWREAAAAARITVSELIRDAMRARLAQSAARAAEAAEAGRCEQNAQK